ncbi:hypothetical protein [Arthrobacter jinronghuae]|uniref:hypothetical protein n=1 Tax=Arthrobacter jinronghuae TaxID=2964609 RepID=UPI002107DBEF|nr:hypothetical protein [Arthrobacter jinronghuae]
MAVQLVATSLGVVLTILVAPFAPLFDQMLSRWHYAEPTCEDPRGLKMLDLRAEGEATVEVSSGEVWSGDSRSAMHAFDGRPGSGWVPETLSARDDDAAAVSAEAPKDEIVLNFTSPQPIALVCVVNGNASDWVSYMRADRVRTVDISFGDGEQEVSHRTSLRTLPEHEIQNRQDLELPAPAAFWAIKPSYDRVSLRLSDRYLGSQVADSNTGQDADAPTRQVMLAEVEVWVHPEQ